MNSHVIVTLLVKHEVLALEFVSSCHLFEKMQTIFDSMTTISANKSTIS